MLISAHRTLALSAGLTEANIADNALATLSGSGQVAPTYWLDHQTGVSHLVDIQTPQTQLTSMSDLETIPIDSGDGDPSGQGAQILGALGTITQVGRPLEISHRDIMPVIDIYANTQGRDLGAVGGAVERVLERAGSTAPHGSSVVMRGQAVTMKEADGQLLVGLAFSILLVYLVMVVNFQSWVDPFIIITALPGALTGIVWSLFLTGTTLSVPALTGAIMRMGTATANSILVVAFGRERLAEHGDAVRAAIEAGYARLRPVLMTALAMVVEHDADVDVKYPERPARARGDRRAARGDAGDLAVRPVRLRLAASEAPSPRSHAVKPRTRLIIGLLAAVVLALLAFGIFKREHALTTLTQISDEQSILPVQIITPKSGPATRPLVLPGTVAAPGTRRRSLPRSPATFTAGPRIMGRR